MPKPPVRRVLLWVGLGALAIFVAIQFVPYGWRHSNPPVTANAPWPDPEAEAIAHRSCYDCHSNETDWPLYSYVAPMSWLVRSDVERGRDKLNFSTWDTGEGEVEDAIEVVADGSMPPDRYTRAHRGTDLSEAEIDTLVAALGQMPNTGGGDDDGGDDDGDDDSGGHGGDDG
jgi:Haem-binding domain